MKLNKIKSPLIIFFASRLAIFILASLFISILPAKNHPRFLEAFSQWDGQWYLKIIKYGYWYKGPNIQSPSIFFPLYPLLGKVLSFTGISPELSLFLIANLACLSFFIFFWLLVKKDFGKKVADIALFYYAISPISYVFSSLYAESLFLLLCCLTFYFLKRKDFLKASLMAGLSSAVRPFGIMLVLPILFVGWKNKEKIWKLAFYLIIASLGLLLFCLHLFLKTGQIAPFFIVQKRAWHHLWLMPWGSIKLFLESILLIKQNNLFFPVAIFDLATVFLFTFLLLFSFKKIDVSYQLFLWPMYFLSMSQPWEPSFFLPSASVSRHLFQMFPLIAYLGAIGSKNKLVHYLIVFFFASLFAPFALAFFHGIWIE